MIPWLTSVRSRAAAFCVAVAPGMVARWRRAAVPEAHMKEGRLRPSSLRRTAGVLTRSGYEIIDRERRERGGR